MKRKELVLIFLILLVALGPRLFGISYGLPYLHLEDEEFFVQPALRVAEGNLNPGWFGAPGQPLIYSLAILFRGASFLLNVVQGTHNPVAINYEEHITLFQSIGRIIPILAGTAMAALVYFIGRVWSMRAGAIAGFLVAGSFYIIDHSHIIRPDILQTALLLFALLCFWYILKNPQSRKWYVLSGIAMGLAITTKFPSAIYIVPGIALFMFLRSKKQIVWKHWGYGLLAVGVAVVVSAPYLFLDPLTAGADIVSEASSQHGGHDGLGFVGNVWWYVSQVFGWQVGTVFYLFGIAGLVLVVYRFARHRQEKIHTFFLVVGVAMISYLLFVSALSLHWERWVIPVAAVISIFVGIGIDAFFTLTGNRKSVIVSVLLIAEVAPFFRTARTIASFREPHTEDAMREWIIEHVPNTSMIAQEPHTPELPTGYATERFANMTVHASSWFQERGFTHYILSGGVHGIIEDEAVHYGEWSSYGHAVKLYGQLFSESVLLYEVRGHSEYETEELLYRNDAAVLRTLDIRMRKGAYQRIYVWRAVDGN